MKTLRPSFALAIGAVLVPTSNLLAQDELEETIVTATRRAVPVDSVGAPVVIITREDIERSLANDVSEILLQQAGLEIARNGGPGQTTALFMRGTESNHTVVLVDGVRINPGTIGGAAIQNLAPEAIERIEIVKGARSSLYGSDAIGGVIQVFTRGAAKNGASVGATFGSDSTQQMFADAAFGAGEKFRFGVGGNYAESDGMPTFVADNVDRGYRNVTGRALAEFKPTDDLAFRLRGWRAAGRTEYTAQTFSTPPYAPVSQDFENGVYSFETEYRRDNGLGIRGTVSHSTDDITQNQANFAGVDFAKTQRLTTDLQVDLPTVAGHTFSFGAQHTAEDTEAMSFGTGFDEETDVTQLFAQDEMRYDWFSARLALGHVDHETFGSELTWNAELGAAFASGTRIALIGGSAFRAPDSTDRFGYGGNPDLDPEVSRQVEVVARQKIGEQHEMSLAAFDNRIRDLITYVVTDFNTFDGENRNVERARIKGVELGYRFRSEGWDARAELTLQNPRDESNDQRLLRRSREQLVLAVSRDVGKLDLGLDIAAFGSRKDFGFPENVNLDAYALVNATVRFRATGALTVQGRLENAFDEAYTFAQGYRTEGRAYTIGVRYSFE
jgi:vitamin B12 transporter